NNEDSVGIERRGEDFAARQVSPFVFRNNSAGFKPSQFRGKLSLKLGAVRRLAGNSFSFAGTLHQALAPVVNFQKVSPHDFEHDLLVYVYHMTVPDFVIVHDAGHLGSRSELAWLRLSSEDRHLRAGQILQYNLRHEFQRTSCMI